MICGCIHLASSLLYKWHRGIFMKQDNNNYKKWIIYTVAFIFVFIGLYNAVVINSDSSVSDVNFMKLDSEKMGIVKLGRRPSVATFKYIEPKTIAKVEEIVQEVSLKDSAPALKDTTSAVQEELELSLVEAINPRMWPQGLVEEQFKGSLTSRNGVLESLNATLPNEISISVVYSEIVGNVFEYNIGNDIYSALIYKVDENSYMVTLTNGPYQGTRLNFSNRSANFKSEVQTALAENHNVKTSNF